MHLGLPRHQLGEHAAEAQRLFAERRTHPVAAGRRGVALVEDEVDHLEHGRQPRRAVDAPRHLEGHAGSGQGALGPHDALGHGRLRDEKGPRDLVGREPPEQAQRQRRARLGRQHGMAGREDQAQQIVPHVVVEGGVEVRGGAPRLELVAQLLVLAIEPRLPPQQIDGAVLGRGHQPGAGIVGDAGPGPLLEGRDERVVCEVLGSADVADDAGESGDDPRRFDAPDGIDGAMGVGGRHDRRSHHHSESSRKRDRGHADRRPRGTPFHPATGRRTVNVAPRPGPSLDASMLPPCSSTSCLQMASPSPMPPCSRA